MKILFGFLGVILLTLQFQLWLGDGSVRALRLVESDLEAQRSNNQQLIDRNRMVEIEVLDLKNGTEAVEERARSELGMIGEDEIFYMILPKPGNGNN
jgi:cell division protein FtsB